MPQNDGGNDVEFGISAQKTKQKKNQKPKSQPVWEGNVRFVVQNDGPPAKTLGFDDDDDDDDDDDEEDETENKSNDKEENNNKQQKDKPRPTAVNIDEIDAIPTDNDWSDRVPHIVNGRDLNGPLCSEDDDTDDGEDLDPADKIICQFTKVVRKKNEWNVDLKHGLMHINGKDYAFQKATGGTFAWQ